MPVFHGRWVCCCVVFVLFSQWVWAERNLDVLFAAYLRIHQSFVNDPVAGFVTFVRSEVFLPRNGIVHVIGSGIHHFEWSVFLLLRPDIKTIVISEDVRTPEEEARYLMDPDGRTLRNLVWEMIVEQNPWLLEYSHLKTYRQFQEAYRRKVRLNSGARHCHFVVHGKQTTERIPNADVVINLMPDPRSWAAHEAMVMHHLKPNGVVWLLTEADDEHSPRILHEYESRNPDGPIALFLSTRVNPVETEAHSVLGYSRLVLLDPENMFGGMARLYSEADIVRPRAFFLSRKKRSTSHSKRFPEQVFDQVNCQSGH